MFSALLQVNSLFCGVMIIPLLKAVKACDSGWFGEACRFKCHCLSSTVCGPEGECLTDGKCSRGFFGPGCQYVDYAEEANNQTDSYLIDANEKTCNNRKNDTSVKVSFTGGIPFTWFRVQVKNSNSLAKFNVSLNDDDPCSNEKRFFVSPTAVDIACDVDYRVFSLQLTGPAAAELCSIYISGGRNVALRQATNQSSIFQDNGADRAVDGGTNSIFIDGSCAHTADESKVAEWILHFNRPYTILKVLVYNRRSFRNRIQNFTLLTFSEEGNIINSYKEARSPQLSVFDIYLTSRIPSVSLRIQRIDLDSDKTRILTICEVETYGEAACPDANYGLFCNKSCLCNVTENCFTVTGACAHGCVLGQYGYSCRQACSPKCQAGYCYQRSGVCQGCEPGYIGAYCRKECEEGTYGAKCTKNCSKNCIDICNTENGHCRCRPPYSGRKCTACVEGKYGANCTDDCSKHCLDGKCDVITGLCKECIGKRMGPFCESCPDKSYGSSCYSSCSMHCLNGTCNQDNGTCPVCIDGYNGARCKYAPSKVSSRMFIIVAICVLVFILLCCCFLHLAKLRRAVIPENPDSEVFIEHGSTSAT